MFTVDQPSRGVPSRRTSGEGFWHVAQWEMKVYNVCCALCVDSHCARTLGADVELALMRRHSTLPVHACALVYLPVHSCVMGNADATETLQDLLCLHCASKEHVRSVSWNRRNLGPPGALNLSRAAYSAKTSPQRRVAPTCSVTPSVHCQCCIPLSHWVSIAEVFTPRALP